MNENNKCPHCESELKKHKAKHDFYVYCDNCYNHVAQLHMPECCHTPRLAEGVYIIANGNRMLRHYCLNCGLMDSNNLKSKGRDISRLPVIDKAVHTAAQNRRFQEWQRFYDRYQEVRKDKFLDQYTVYLNSPLWKEKRRLVLERDKHLCQSCLVAKATQVHHLSYRHLYNEPLFELVSVCEPCHDSITNMDNEREFKLINHKPV